MPIPEIDALLKGIIAKAALAGLLVVSVLLALLCVGLVLWKMLRHKPLKTKLVLGCLLTPVLTLVFAWAIASLGAICLFQFVVKPVNERRCRESMHTIAEATKIWATNHDGHVPQNILSLSNHLKSPQLLICPATGRFTDGTYRLADVSYEFLASGADIRDTNSVLLRCSVHHYSAFIDGRILEEAAIQKP